MKKLLILLVLIVILISCCCCIFESSVQSKGYSDPIVLECGDNYKVLKLSPSEYCYEIYNNEGRLVDRKNVNNAIPSIEALEKLLVIKYYYGPGISEYCFYDLANENYSAKYQYVIIFDSEKIAYLSGDLDNRAVVIHNIFDTKQGYVEKFLEFTAEPMPVSSAEYINNGTQLKICYRQKELDRIGIAITDIAR